MAPQSGLLQRLILKDQLNSLSPDITHQRLFKADDRFDLVVARIYQNPQYYIDVAKANGLTGFRKIKTGTKLFFPPVEK